MLEKLKQVEVEGANVARTLSRAPGCQNLLEPINQESNK